MDYFEEIKELIELVADRKLQGLKIEGKDFRLKIEGQAPPPVAATPPAAATATAPGPAAPTPATTGSGPAAASAGQPAAAREGEEEAEEAEGLPEDAHVLESPIVGTFYRAPDPDGEPFVQRGDRVTKGQVLCIVEAMKLMNEIEADIAGEVLEIFPKNAQPVEFGEPLFAIRPD